MEDFSEFYVTPIGITANNGLFPAGLTGLSYSTDLNACFVLGKFIAFIFLLYGCWRNLTPQNKSLF